MSGLRKKPGNYVTVDNAVAEDAALSFRARGILLYLLAKPDGWDVRSEAIARDGREGREAVRTALRELGARGYYRLASRQVEGGRWITETQVSPAPVRAWAVSWASVGEEPQRVPASRPVATGDGFPGAGSPDAGAPDAGSPGASVTPISKDAQSPPTPSGRPPSPLRGGRRIPADFEVTADMATWAVDNAPLVDLSRESDQFRDYWAAATGRTSLKRDWTAAWRTWMRRAQSDADKQRAKTGGLDPIEGFLDRQRGQHQ